MARRIFVRKNAAILALAIGISTVLSGCGSNEQTENSPETYPAAPASVETSEVPSDSILLEWDSPEQLQEALLLGRTALSSDGDVEIVSYTGLNELYAARRLTDDMFGVYNLGTGSYVSDPIYTSIGRYSAGLALTSYQGYYGYIDQNGNKAIGFMFDEGTDFLEEGISLIKTAGYWGVIDKQGANIVDTVYTGLDIDEENQIISGHRQDGGLDLFFFDGSKCTSESCYGYEVRNGLLYTYQGQTESHGQIKDGSWYSLYDLNGSKLIGDGTELPGVVAVTLPVNGVCIAYGDTNRKNQHDRYQDWWYEYIDDQGHPLSDNIYIWYATLPNEQGYSVAAYNYPHYAAYSTSSVLAWAVLGSNGTELYQLTDESIRKAADYYANANDYFIYGYSFQMNSTKTGFVLVSLDTHEITQLSDEPEFVSDTNCIIVRDGKSGLYGLYDGDELALDYIYNDLQYDGTDFVGHRGAETFNYMPESGS